MRQQKKERPEAATSKRSVQGLAPENNSMVIVACFARNCKPCQRGGEPPMTGWTLFFVVLGVCTATNGIFRVIDLIEGR